MTNDYVTDINVGKIESDDCISREYLINKIGSVENSNLFAKHYMDIVKSAPSVTPTRPTARWERLVEDYNKCSKCGEMGKLYRIYKYCPNCGAKMEAKMEVKMVEDEGEE